MVKKLSILLCMLLCLNVLACSAEDVCHELTVYIHGEDDYVPDNELVMIRFYSDEENATAPVLYETRTSKGVGSICIAPGEYWLDVRNIWIKFNISEDRDIIFPFPLFDDADHYTGNNSANDENISDYIIFSGVFIGIALFCIVFAFVATVLSKRKKNNKEKKEEENDTLKKEF